MVPAKITDPKVKFGIVKLPLILTEPVNWCVLLNKLPNTVDKRTTPSNLYNDCDDDVSFIVRKKRFVQVDTHAAVIEKFLEDYRIDNVEVGKSSEWLLSELKRCLDKNQNISDILAYWIDSYGPKLCIDRHNQHHAMYFAFLSYQFPPDSDIDLIRDLTYSF